VINKTCNRIVNCIRCCYFTIFISDFSRLSVYQFTKLTLLFIHKDSTMLIPKPASRHDPDPVTPFLHFLLFFSKWSLFKRFPTNFHHHMVLQPNTGPGLPFWGFVTVTFLQGWIVSPAPNPPTWRTSFRIYDP
jgi:hypothetical protein